MPRIQPKRALRTLRSALTPAIGIAILAAPADSAASVTPLSPANYAVRSICTTATPGYAGCLAKELIPISAEAKARTRPLGRVMSNAIASASAAAGAYGLRPQDLHSAYQLPQYTASAQTIAIVDAYDDPRIEADLAAYSREFSLPECTSANGCFTKINAAGNSAPLPPESGEWSFEIALDVESAHAICQNCRILLVEAESNSNLALAAAENRAAASGATEISNSFGGPEPATENEAFNHPGIVITAAAGDNGYLGWAAYQSSERNYVNYPASSPHVVAVGATRLILGSNGERLSESVWNDGAGASGGGCSANFTAPAWQQETPGWANVGCGSKRAVTDVSAVGDPYSGVAIYDSTPWAGYTLNWVTAGGTSLASPLVAATFALAGGAGGAAYPAQSLYLNAAANPAAVRDITAGSSGACTKPLAAGGQQSCSEAEEAASCQSHLICLAGAGYDGPSGLGSGGGGLALFTANARALQASAVTGASRGGINAGGGPSVAAPKEAGAVPPPAAGSHHKRGSRRGRARASVHHLHVLHHRRHAGSTRSSAALAVAFDLSSAARVQLRMVRLGAGGHAGSGRLPARSASHAELQLALAAHRGPNSWQLLAADSLAPGYYRLTLAPAGGAQCSLTVRVG